MKGSKLAGKSLRQKLMMRNEQMMVPWPAVMFGPSVLEALGKPY